MKKIKYVGKSLKALSRFPCDARKDANYQLEIVSEGEDPIDWKPMKTIGKGVREIRLRDASGIYRVIYVASFKEAVYVLHAFQKKTWETSRRDIDIAKRNYRELMK